MPKVFNKRHGDAPEGAIYVGRPTKWGNPFVIRPGMTREQVVSRFKAYAVEKSLPVHELKGKDLVCWCAPKMCHADVLLEMANEGS